jgi:hypothetical protein
MNITKEMIDAAQKAYDSAPSLGCVFDEPRMKFALEAALKNMDSTPWPNWRSPDEKPVAASNTTPRHFSISVLAMVDDPRIVNPGEDCYIDTASYWPALDKWTMTFAVNKDEAEDREVKIKYWMPKPLPPGKKLLPHASPLSDAPRLIGFLRASPDPLHPFTFLPEKGGPVVPYRGVRVYTIEDQNNGQAEDSLRGV